jgi:hypothetical protein
MHVRGVPHIGLQFCFRLHVNRRSTQKIIGDQNDKNPNFENFGTLDLGVLGKNVAPMANHRE